MAETENLAKLELLLKEVLNRLEKLEELILTHIEDPTMRLALELAMSFQIPVLRATQIALRISNVFLKERKKDPISLAILMILAMEKRSMSVSELSRKVKELRGTASRRVISEKVKMLEEKGILRTSKTGRSLLVALGEEDVNQS
ncbi:MAG: ArsR family transcriptional regulator [Fervidicoccaceae archaeon]